jgi:hypothetical protein
MSNLFLKMEASTDGKSFHLIHFCQYCMSFLEGKDIQNYINNPKGAMHIEASKDDEVFIKEIKAIEPVTMYQCRECSGLTISIGDKDYSLDDILKGVN